MHAVVDERLVAREVGVERQIGARDAHGVEAEPPGLRDDALLGTFRPHGRTMPQGGRARERSRVAA